MIILWSDYTKFCPMYCIPLSKYALRYPCGFAVHITKRRIKTYITGIKTVTCLYISSSAVM